MPQGRPKKIAKEQQKAEDILLPWQGYRGDKKNHQKVIKLKAAARTLIDKHISNKILRINIH